MIVAPSILAADFGELRKDIRKLNKQPVWLHCDIMDGCYNPNLSFGFPVLEAIANSANKPLDVHLMVVDPIKYIERLAELPAVMLITVHYEAFVDCNGQFDAEKCKECLDAIKLHKYMRAGLAIEPGTPFSAVKDLTDDIDVLLIMSVQSGYGGQKFIETTYDKVIEAREYMQNKIHKVTIEVDGGVNTENCKKLAACGTDMVVAGTAVFKSEDMSTTIKLLSCNETE